MIIFKSSPLLPEYVNWDQNSLHFLFISHLFLPIKTSQKLCFKIWHELFFFIYLFVSVSCFVAYENFRKKVFDIVIFGGIALHKI